MPDDDDDRAASATFTDADVYPHISDDEVLELAGYPLDPTTMSMEEKKAVAGELRRGAAERAAENDKRRMEPRTEIKALSEQGFERAAEPPSKTRYLWLTLWACLAVGTAYLVFRPPTKTDDAEEVWPNGFADLLDCEYTGSLDGTKELDLLDNQHAVLYDKSIEENGKYHTVEGSWAFNETAKSYTVTLNGNATSYSLVKPPGICMLVKGDGATADLQASWFSRVDGSGDSNPAPVRGD
jgi:hypothetical protein